MTTETSEILYPKTALQPELYQQDSPALRVRTKGNVVFGEFVKQPKMPAGSVDIDDLVAELTADDQELTDLLREARGWVAEEFYGDQVSMATVRLKAGLSQKAVAEAAGTSQPYIARLEAGKVSPQLETVHKIAKALGITTARLSAILVEKKWNE